MQLAAGKHVLLNRIHQRAEQIAGASDPAGQRRAGNLYALASVDLRLPVQRLGYSAFQSFNQHQKLFEAGQSETGEIEPFAACDFPFRSTCTRKNRSPVLK